MDDELRIGSGRTPSDHFGGKVDVKARITALMASLPPETQQAIRQLAQADPGTRKAVLDKLDKKTALTMATILAYL